MTISQEFGTDSFSSYVMRVTLLRKAREKKRRLVSAEPTVADILGTEFEASKFSLNAKEAQIMKTIFLAAHRDLAAMGEILCGAHVVLFKDQGALYNNLSECPHGLNPYKRISSHFSSSPQMGFNLGKCLRTLLIGTTKEGDTWFQFEAAAWGKGASLAQHLKHSASFLKYCITGFNQGPLGSSKYTEANPLIIETIFFQNN